MQVQHLVIIGGGFAGFWSAMSAVRQARELEKHDKLKITLISKDEYHGIRPRFYEEDLAGTRIPIRNYLEPLKIDLIVDEVSSIDAENRRIFFANGSGEIFYDTLIIAAGSRLKASDIPGFEQAFSVDTFQDATRLDQHLRKLSAAGFSTPSSRNLVVVGGGFTGLEVVTSLPQRVKAHTPNGAAFNYFLIERSTGLALNYSVDAQHYIADQLKSVDIQLLLGEEAERIETGRIVLKTGKSIDTDTVIWTTGLEASPLTANLKSERDELGRLGVDNFLRLPTYHNVFAAGDVVKVLVDDQNYAVMSCQHAMPQGKFAGHNAVNFMFDREPLSYLQPRYATCLDLGPENALLTVGWERDVKVLGPEAKGLKRQINTQWIYPAQNVEETIKMSAPEVMAS